MPEIPFKPKPLLDEERLPPVLGAGARSAARLRGAALPVSNFSFQRGASHPQELVRRAYDLGYEALAITDECSVAGVVRAWSGLKRVPRLHRPARSGVPGPASARASSGCCTAAEFDFGDGRLVAIARDLAGWGDLCEFITAARMTAPKGAVPRGLGPQRPAASCKAARCCSCRRASRPGPRPGRPVRTGCACCRPCSATASGWP